MSRDDDFRVFFSLSHTSAGIGYGSGGGSRRQLGVGGGASTGASVGSAGSAGSAVGGVSAGESSVAAHLGALAGLSSSDDEGVDGHLGLGELAQLTVNNEAEVSYDVRIQRFSLLVDSFQFARRTMNEPKRPVLFGYKSRRRVLASFA